MSNLLSSSRVVIFLRNFSFMHRIVLSISLLSSFLIGYIFIFLLPIQSKISEQLSDYQNNLIKQSSYKKVIASFDENKNLNKDLLEKYNSILTQKISDKDLINNIFIFLKQHNIFCNSFAPVKVKDKKYYKKEYYQLKVNGNFFNLSSFLSELESSSELLKIKKLEIKRKKDGNVLLKSYLRLVSN